MDGKHLVTRAEADDGSAMIEVKLQLVHGRLEGRTRYVAPYNFIVAAAGAPLMSTKYDRQLQDHPNAMLKGQDKLPDIANDIMRLEVVFDAPDLSSVLPSRFPPKQRSRASPQGYELAE